MLELGRGMGKVCARSAIEVEWFEQSFSHQCSHDTVLLFVTPKTDNFIQRRRRQTMLAARSAKHQVATSVLMKMTTSPRKTTTTDTRPMRNNGEEIDTLTAYLQAVDLWPRTRERRPRCQRPPPLSLLGRRR